MTDTFADSRTVEQIIENIIILTQKQTKQIIDREYNYTDAETDRYKGSYIYRQPDR